MSADARWSPLASSMSDEATKHMAGGSNRQNARKWFKAGFLAAFKLRDAKDDIVLTLELTRGEQATLARALQVYAAKYQELVGREHDRGFKQDLQNYIARADELLRRVRPELQHGPKEPA